MERSVWLSYLVLGAIVGGFFPGASVAFLVSLGAALEPMHTEAVCLTLNVMLGIIGTSLVLYVGQRLEGVPHRWRQLWPSSFAGAVSGASGYVWALLMATTPGG